MLEERIQPVQRLLRALVENPTVLSNGTYAPGLRFSKQFRRTGGQMSNIVFHGRSSSICILNKGDRFAGVDTAECAQFPAIGCGLRA